MGLKEQEAAKVNAIGDAIRALKKEKASKEVIMAEVGSGRARLAGTVEMICSVQQKSTTPSSGPTCLFSACISVGPAAQSAVSLPFLYALSRPRSLFLSLSRPLAACACVCFRT
eukprot:COSAG02_NODE_3548_length_6580_cov_2104.438358_7_plen_114_part_00